MTTTAKHIESLTFTVPTRNQGQIVEISYSQRGNIRKYNDRSLPLDHPERVTYERKTRGTWKAITIA
jgi:hypothetical protein